MEIQLKQRVLEMEGLFYGMTTTDLRRIAYDFAEANNINHVFNRRRRLAGKDWMLDFIRRHKLSVRTPQSTSMNRVVAFDREKVTRFFELLKSLYDCEKIEPHRIYNLDESGVTTVPEPGKILALKGRKQVGRIASGEKGRTVTVVASINATGHFLPPAMIFPRQRMNDRLLHGALPGTVGYNSGNGWIDSTLFLRYLDHFIKHVKPTPDSKVLLILDNHISRKSLEAIDKAKANSIILLTLPPHTSSKLQPLDRSVFKALKTYYSQECSIWMTNHMGRKITEYDIASIMGPAFLKAMSPTNIISGFKSTGIWPYNPDVIDEENYATASAIRNIDPSEEDATPTTSAATSSSTQQVAPSDCVAACNAESSAGESTQPSTADATSSETETLHIPLNVVSPRPKVVPRSKRGNIRSPEQAEIITASPYKKQLMERMANKNAKDAGTRKNQKSTKPAVKKSTTKTARGNAKRKKSSHITKALKSVASSDKDNSDCDCECLYCLVLQYIA